MKGLQKTTAQGPHAYVLHWAPPAPAASPALHSKSLSRSAVPVLNISDWPINDAL